MRLRDLFGIARESIRRTRGRAALTMLGIVIGIASVILMLSIGQAAEGYLLSQIASFGSDMIFVANGKGDEEENGPPTNSIKESLAVEDYRELRRTSWVKGVAASVIVQDLATVDSVNALVQISGSSPEEVSVYSIRPERGRFIDDDDVNSRRTVTVLGPDIAKRLFGTTDPIGQQVRLGRRSYRVIGIMEPGGTRFFDNLDDQIYIPFTTALEQYNRTHLNFLSLKPVSGVNVREAMDRTRILLRDTHRIDNPEGALSKDDFQVASQEDAIRSAGVIGQVLQILLASVAAISLVVGGIGIMNIMLVTVTERTREIGLRKSIGAKRSDILGQFILEAVCLTVAGGVIGIILGIGISYGAIALISQFQEGWTFVFPGNGILLATGVSTAIGLVFGYYPARKAATLSPIEALRYE
jgi:putative ABC transport system permease protein